MSAYPIKALRFLSEGFDTLSEDPKILEAIEMAFNEGREYELNFAELYPNDADLGDVIRNRAWAFKMWQDDVSEHRGA